MDVIVKQESVEIVYIVQTFMFTWEKNGTKQALFSLFDAVFWKGKNAKKKKKCAVHERYRNRMHVPEMFCKVSCWWYDTKMRALIDRLSLMTIKSTLTAN